MVFLSMIESAVMPHRPDPIPGEELKDSEVKVVPPRQPEPEPEKLEVKIGNED